MTPKNKTPGAGGDSTPGRPGDGPDGKRPLKVGDVDATDVSDAHAKIEDKLTAGRQGNGEGTTPGKGESEGRQQPRDPKEPPDGVTFDDPRRPNLGSDGKYYIKPGDQSVVIDDPADYSRTITDIDNPQDGVLWEEKSATSAGDVDKWVNKQVVKKLEAYIEARQYISGYENAPIGIQFTTPGADPAFRTAVENAVAGLRTKHPGVDIRVEWAQ
jgi:hypothetical protein